MNTQLASPWAYASRKAFPPQKQEQKTEVTREDVERMALDVKELRAEEEKLSETIKVLQEQKKAVQEQSEQLRKELMEILDGETFRTQNVTVKYGTTVSVVISDLTALPEEYLEYSDPKPKKALIKKALQSGEVISGAALEESKYITVK